MSFLNPSDRRFGVFVILSVIIHGGLFFAFPNLMDQMSLGSLWGKDQGVIQVVRVEPPSDSAELQGRGKSAQAVPQPAAKLKPQPKPKPKPEPKPELKPESKPKPKPQPHPKQEPPKSESKPKVSSEKPAASVVNPAETVEHGPKAPKVQEPKETSKQIAPQTGSKPKAPSSSGLLTSEQGKEVVVAQKKSDVAPQQEEAASGPKKTPTANEEAKEQEAKIESTPESEPEPPPLPSASAISPGAALAYPKGAQNEGIGGIWAGRVLFPAGGKPPVVISVTKATGNRSLDNYAERVLEKGLRYPIGSIDYVAEVRVVFTGAPEYAVRIEIGKIDYAE